MKRMARLARVSVLAAPVAGILVSMPSCTSEGGGSLKVFHAGSLTVPFEALEAEFEAAYPEVDVILESGGSAERCSTLIALEEAGEMPPDILASADYKLIPSRLYEGGYADWYVAFARNDMVLCYREGAPGSADVKSGSASWYSVLRNEEVSYGHSDPDLDPCGYRTLMVMELAEKYYYEEASDFGLTPDPDAENLYDVLIPGGERDRGRTGGPSEQRTGGSEEVVSPKSVDLISALQSGDLDYAFEYRSVAVQHSISFIELDGAVNLSDLSYEEFYSEATVELQTQPGSYSTTTGAPIVYGVTVPTNAGEYDLAVEFVSLLLSETGQSIMEDMGQPAISPAICDKPSQLPQELRQYVA